MWSGNGCERCDGRRSGGRGSSGKRSRTVLTNHSEQTTHRDDRINWRRNF
jgi:hypothetical protein